MSIHLDDLHSLLSTMDAYLRTRVSLYLDVDALIEADGAAQRQAREMLDEHGLAHALHLGAGQATTPPEPPETTDEEPAAYDGGLVSLDEEVPAAFTDGASGYVSIDDDIDTVAAVEPDPHEAPADDLDLALPEEPTQVDLDDDLVELDLDELGIAPEEEDPAEEPEEIDFDDLGLEEIDGLEEIEIGLEELDETTPGQRQPAASPFPGSFEDASEGATVLSTSPAPLEPMPVLEIDDEDVSDPATLGDPDETEDLLRDADDIGFDPTSMPTFSDDDDDLISEPRELAEIEIEEPGEDALITIEDTSDPRSDLEGLSRLSDSDLDDDPDTGNDEVIVRTTEPAEPESVDLLSDSDFSPDDEETFVADLADIEKMKAKMASMEDTSDDRSENEVLLPPPESKGPRLGTPRAVAGVGVAGVAAGVAGVRAGGAGGAGGPQVTQGLYGNPSVPQIRDRNAPKPRAAAIQIDAAQEESARGSRSGAVLEEEELLELGGVEDYGEEEVDVSAGDGGGLSLDVQEYEEAYEEVEEDDIELEELDVEAEPLFDDSVDEAEVKRLIGEAEQAVEDGDLELAIDLYSDVLDNDPENPKAHIRRGRLYLDYGDYSRAMSDFMLAEDLAPENPEPQIAVGDLYFARKDYSRAIGHFNDALKMDPNNAMAFCRRGISHYYRKHFAEALADLKQAEKLDDDIPNIRTYIAMAKKKAKK